MKTFCKFTLNCAHKLPFREINNRVHGHTYTVTVCVKNDCDIQDLLDECHKLVVSHLDHRMLNDVLPTPTCERMAAWIYAQFAPPWDIINVKVERDIGGAVYP